jgi:hypothetical protein
MKRNAFLMSILLSAALLAGLASCGTKPEERDGTVNGNQVRMRDKPSITGKIKVHLNDKQKVKVLETVQTGDAQYGEWYRVRLKEKNLDVEGYVFSQFVSVAGADKKSGSAFMKIMTKDNSIRIEYAGSEVNVFDNKTDRKITGFKVDGQAGKIDNSKEASFLFLSVRDDKSGAVLPVFSGILDTVKGEWVIKFDRKPELAGPSVLSWSPSKKYAVIDSGTAAASRNLTVVDMQAKKVEHSTSYIPQGFKTGIKWEGDGAFQFYMEDHECKKPVPQPPHASEAFYIKKLVKWDHKKETVLEDCLKNY